MKLGMGNRLVSHAERHNYAYVQYLGSFAGVRGQFVVELLQKWPLKSDHLISGRGLALQQKLNRKYK